MSVSKEVTRDVAFRSGNICAFTNCCEPIYDTEEGVYVGELAHIEAESEGGLRYNPDQTDKERNGVQNLMFMCRNHHGRIDKKANVKKYTVEVLREMKKNHEASVQELDKKIVKKIVKGAQEYLLENSNEIDLTQAAGLKKWLKKDQDYDKESIESIFDDLSFSLEQIGELKGDTQSFIYSFLVHGKEDGSPLEIIMERSEIEENRIRSIVKLLLEEKIINDRNPYSLEERVMSLNDNLSHQIQYGIWKLDGRFSSLYTLIDYLKSRPKENKLRDSLKLLLFERDISPLK
ncbi:HNH endonuclease [Paenibacillus vini]|uniref:HNH nuclease domain-containing protein n=1 Tax=Paenibacillus vini TaxID=1476024 RepID=A0ABQ4MAG4_9BACL|nr:HNH endonuclease [Paenibacillus vini]GIP52913.1 hypothetical protein J42TS3_19480 [Paenibacillus vini]